MVKNLPPAVQETQVQSLSQEDPLEKGMATHSSILAWRIPWTEEPSADEFGISERLSKTQVQFTWNLVEMWAFSLIPQELELLVQRG